MTNLLKKYVETRSHTLDLCSGLETEDYNLQGAEFASPPKWHLAHTTWFFEEMILKTTIKEYRVFDKSYAFLFNSYYNTLGNRVLRKHRGLLSRPGKEQVFKYRAYIDQHIVSLLKQNIATETHDLINLGIQHEEQHQELLQSDLKYSFSLNPTYPVYDDNNNYASNKNEESGWEKVSEGLYEIGHDGKGFCFDNEMRRHKVYLEGFEISKSLISNNDYLEFINDDGYQHVEYWLDEGWSWIKNNNITAPLYWQESAGEWRHFTLSGMKKLEGEAIMGHISYYEAMAYATWKGCRLATEFEWECASEKFKWGSRWEWTNSAYLPYPGFTLAGGAVGEYNGKFMINQMVLRGASSATTTGHSRSTYRNFFHPHLRWQLTGIRLVKS